MAWHQNCQGIIIWQFPHNKTWENACTTTSTYIKGGIKCKAPYATSDNPKKLCNALTNHLAYYTDIYWRLEFCIHICSTHIQRCPILSKHPQIVHLERDRVVNGSMIHHAGPSLIFPNHRWICFSGLESSRVLRETSP